MICSTSHWEMRPKFKCDIPVSWHQLCCTKMLHRSQPTCKMRHHRHNDPKPQHFSQHLGNKDSDIVVFSISTASIISMTSKAKKTHKCSMSLIAIKLKGLVAPGDTLKNQIQSHVEQNPELAAESGTRTYDVTVNENQPSMSQCP